MLLIRYVLLDCTYVYCDDYYVYRTLTEQQALDYLIGAMLNRDDSSSLRQICEQDIPSLARFVGKRDGDYYEIFLSALEHEAKQLNIDSFEVRTDIELMDAINNERKEQT